MRDVKTLIIFILCVMVTSIGGFITYSILDNGELKAIAKSYNKKIYLSEVGSVSFAESSNLLLNIETDTEDITLLDYLMDNYSNELKYVLYKDGENIYYYHNKSRTLLTKYIRGSYRLSYDNNLNVTGYFFHNDNHQYYYKLETKEKLLSENVYPDHAISTRNSFNGYLISFDDYKPNKCNNGIVTRINDNTKIIGGTSLSFFLYDSKVFIIDNINCLNENYSIYNLDAKLLTENTSYLNYSFAKDGILYVNKDNEITKYDYEGANLESNKYQKVIELHDGYALINENSKPYILRLTDNKKCPLDGKIVSYDDQYFYVNKNELMINVNEQEQILKLNEITFE